MVGKDMYFFPTSLSQNCNEASPKKMKQCIFLICIIAGEENSPGKWKKMWSH